MDGRDILLVVSANGRRKPRSALGTVRRHFLGVFLPRALPMLDDPVMVLFCPSQNDCGVLLRVSALSQPLEFSAARLLLWIGCQAGTDDGILAVAAGVLVSVAIACGSIES
jgi:hypothetical protein